MPGRAAQIIKSEFCHPEVTLSRFVNPEGIPLNPSSLFLRISIFSRAFCNFVFPAPDIKRPMPGGKDEDIETAILDKTADEDLLDAATAEERIDNVDGRFEADELKETKNMSNYEERIQEALALLETKKLNGRAVSDRARGRE